MILFIVHRIYLLTMASITNDSARNLLSKLENKESQEFERQSVSYEDLTSNFDDKLVDYSKQFCSIYAARLAELRETLIPRVIAKWGELYTISTKFHFVVRIHIFLYTYFMIALELNK